MAKCYVVTKVTDTCDLDGSGEIDIRDDIIKTFTDLERAELYADIFICCEIDEKSKESRDEYSDVKDLNVTYRDEAKLTKKWREQLTPEGIVYPYMNYVATDTNDLIFCTLRIVECELE